MHGGGVRAALNRAGFFSLGPVSRGAVFAWSNERRGLVCPESALANVCPAALPSSGQPGDSTRIH